MESESLYINGANTMLPTYNSLNFGEETHPYKLNCSSEQLPNCLLKSTWGDPLDQRDPFESALSSMVSSPVASDTKVPVSNGDSIAFLQEPCIGGSNSAGTSCYNTLLNSPPKLNLSIMDQQIRENPPVPGNHLQIHPGLVPFSADPGFVERAARLSCLGNRNYGDPYGQFGLNESELPHRSTPRVKSIEPSRVSSDQSLMGTGSLSVMGAQENKNGFLQNGFSAASDKKYAELGNSPEGSSVSEQIPGGEIGTKGCQNDGGSARKRKSIPRGKSKEIQSPPHTKHAKDASESDESEAKRSKPDETTANGSGKSVGDRNEKQRKDNSKPPEPPKDYIHVRARRGEATDSHSLAERVRREKISERMKFLQNLVPGCNKVIGKAVMLDEIINYVQSLQRQVEFLSMKIATVNPVTDLNMEAPLSYDIFQSSRAMPHIHSMHPIDTLAPALPYRYQSQQGPHLPNGTDSPFSPSSLSAALCRNSSMQLPPIGEFGEAASQAQWPYP